MKNKRRILPSFPRYVFEKPQSGFMEDIMRKLKIIHVIQGIVIHGAEKMLVDMAIGQKKSGHDVTVVSQYARQGNAYEDALEEAGVRVIYFGKPLGFNLPHMAKLTRFMKAEHPDVVHTHLHAAIYLVPYYMIDRRCAKVHTVHSIATFEFGYMHRMFQRFAYKFLGEVPVSICKSVQKTMIDEYGFLKNPPVIYNSIVRSDFNLPKISHDNFVFVNVASHTDVKNQAMLLNAFAKAAKRRNGIRLRLIGDGPNRQALEQQAKALGIFDYVEFLGIRHDVPELLAKSDVFVLSSDTEGMPLSILEAFAAGLPVLSTDVSGSRDVVENGINGFIVPIGDAAEMADKMVCFAENTPLTETISVHNREYSKEFDFDVMEGKYTELYYELLGEG